MSDLISSLKRLERTGSECSRSTEKLRVAADVVGRAIVANLPEEVRQGWQEERALPVGQGYLVDGYDQARLLVSANRGGDEHWLPVDFDRETALGFARDIAGGLLSGIAAWLESRAEQADEGVRALEETRTPSA